MSDQKKFETKKAARPVGAYPHACEAGHFVFLSGIGPRQAGSNSIPGFELDKEGHVVSYDFEKQVHAVMKNVKAVLHAAGLEWENLIDITVFLVNMERDFNTFNAIYSTYFTDHQPCRTTVEVNALPTPIAIELKCIAYKP